MRHRLFIPAATALLLGLAACTQDELADGNRLPEGEYPVVIRATGLSVEATPQAAPSTRATVDGDWQGVQTVALKMGDAVKEYTVTATDADGYKSATLSRTDDPHYWTSREDITVSAWWPYSTTMPDVVVKADQSTKEGFEGSDFISAEAQAVQFDHPMLEFSHRTARITVLLKPGDGITSVTGADVYVTGLGTDNSNPATIRTYEAGGDTYEALTAPQTVKANTPFIQVDLGGGTYYFRPKSDVVLAAGSRYIYTINVNATGLTLEGCTIGDWESGGSESGTAEDLGYFIQDDGSYTVYTADGLMAWNEAAQSDYTLNCTLTADINMTGKTWTPVGMSINYSGTFDGQGHTITGLNISSPSEAVALFGDIGGAGKVMNLQLKDVTYKGSTAMGGIAHGNSGTITACSVTGTLTNTTNNGDVGGIAAINYGTITACWFNGTITGGSNVGGIAVFNLNAGSYDGKITACYWSGDGISDGVWGGDDTSGTTKVDNSTVTWQTAVGGMNAALTGNDYQWKLGTDGLPVLQSNQ